MMCDVRMIDVADNGRSKRCNLQVARESTYHNKIRETEDDMVDRAS